MKRFIKKIQKKVISHKNPMSQEKPIFENLEPRLLLNADITGLAAGEDVTNETAIEADLNNMLMDALIVTPQSAPYTQDFTAGKPAEAQGWEYYSDKAEGRIQVVGGRLRMDETAYDNYVLNEAILHLDLTNKADVTLTLDHWNLNDEDNGLPASFTGHFKGDGISLSVDGVNWIKITDLTTSFVGQSFSLDAIIAQAKTAAGSTDASDVRIKFQQYDNYPVISGGGDGREFDNIAVTAESVNTLPYTQDFSAGKPTAAQGWEYYSDNPEGRIKVINGRLRMDEITNDKYVLNEAILHLDLTNKSNVTLTLDHWNLNDEDHGLPTSFTGHFKGDGISLSVDGVNWIKITDLTTSFIGQSFSLDSIIAQAKAAAGSTDVSDVQIKFQQYDNYPVISGGGDGREFDNISVTGKTVQTLPYTQDFTAGKPSEAQGWEYYSDTPEGRIEVVNGRLRMDETVHDNNNLNEAILHLDLTNKTDITLTLDHWSLNDENSGIPTSFTGHFKGDGISLSVDGINWIKITDLTGSFIGQSFALDSIIAQAKAAAGSTDLSNVRIKFQQYDNFPVISGGGDGREFDNISVTGKTVNTLPYAQDFSAAKPAESQGWEYYSDKAEGRIEVVNGRLRMDETVYDNDALNEAILHLNLTNKTNVTLTLDHWSLNDENNGLPTSFTGHYKGDGIALSVDGVNWIRVTNLTGSFTGQSFALDSIIAQAKIAAGSNDLTDVQIKFQQYDNYPVISGGGDGREFDNISVTGESVNALPYTQDFSAGTPTSAQGWEYYSDNPEGRIEVVNGRLRMDETVNDNYVLNEAILHLDLTNQTNVTLTLDHWNLNDESTGLPTSFTGHYKGDGIALSIDGVNWIRVTNLTGSFTGQSFALDSIIAQAKIAAGSNDVSDVQIKFQQYDNFPVISGGGDGREFDNISVTGTLI